MGKVWSINNNFGENKKIKENYIFILSFILPMVIMFVVFTSLGVGFIGDKTIVSSDMYTQYVAYFGKFKDILSGDGSIFYSFNKSIGGNNIGLFAYYLASPLNLLLILFPKSAIGEFIFIIYLIKIGLASLCFSLYISKVYKKKDLFVVIFSLCYALMSYNICFQMNIMWMDGMMLLPLVALGIEEIILKGKYKLYMIVLFMVVVSNYYIGYMICIFSVVYFFYKSIIYKKISLPRTFKFFCASFITGGLASFLLIPVLISLSTGKADFNLFSEAITIKQNLSSFLSKLFIGSYNMGQVMKSPTNIYCSVMVAELLMLYFFNKEINIRNKIASLIVMVFIALSFFISTFILLWHGFDYPIGFQYRNSFIFCFFIIILAYECWLKIKRSNFNGLIIIVLFFAVASIYVSYGEYDYLATNKIIATFIISLCYIIVFMICIKFNTISRIILPLISLLVITELTLNAYLSMKNIKYIDKAHIGEYIETVSPLIEEVKSLNDNFYRIEQVYRNTLNDSMLLNYNGLGHSSSANEESTGRLIKNFGFKTSTINEIYNMGTTIPIDSILGIKYLISMEEPEFFKCYKYKQNMFYNKIKTEGNYAVYQNPYALPIAFMVNEALESTKSNEAKNKFAYNNDILKSMVNENYDIYKELNVTDIKLNNLSEVKYDDETVYQKEIKGVKATIELTLKAQEYGPVYMFLKSSEYENGFSSKKSNISSQNGVSITVNSNVKYDQFTGHGYNIQFIGTYHKDEEITIEIFVLNDSFSIDEVQLYYCHMDKFQEVYKNLSSNIIENTVYEDGYVKGNIEVTADKTLMYTSIPYDEGWSLKVDGEDYDYFKILDGLIGVKLQPGEHKIEFKYKLPGLELGIGISIFSLGILILAFKNKKRVFSKLKS
ncbi:YfhO family protein [Clostridium sp.]